VVWVFSLAKTGQIDCWNERRSVRALLPSCLTSMAERRFALFKSTHQHRRTTTTSSRPSTMSWMTQSAPGGRRRRRTPLLWATSTQRSVQNNRVPHRDPHLTMDLNRWARRVMEWTLRDGHRSRGRQKKRWGDDITRVAGKNWPVVARSGGWRQLEEQFVMSEAG
jgi:hypothetical protein